MNDLIQIALTQYGVKEIQGAEANNPEIIKYFAACGQMWAKTDETSWCSAFVNWCAIGTGHEHTRKLDARSWLKIGEPIEKFQHAGDIVVLWRVSRQDWRGHVGIYVNEDDENIWILGGNQSNSVCIKPYPKSRLLGYRRLKHDRYNT